MTLDKSSGSTGGLDSVRERLARNVPSVIVCSEPFDKAAFLIRLTDSADCPVIFVDFDGMHSGYVESGMVQKRDGHTVLRPQRDRWKEVLTDIVSEASLQRTLVVIDSLNGIYNMYDDLDAARSVNSCLMLLAATARQVGSSVVITAMARKKDAKRWVLSPGGRQIMGSQGSMLYVRESEGRLVLTEIGSADSEKFVIAK